MNGDFSFSSESVTEGHPDKIADQISDAVLDAVLESDPAGRVACETLVTTGLVVIAGELTTDSWVDMSRLARSVIRDIGYVGGATEFDAKTCGVVVAIDEQSQDISQGVTESFEAQHGNVSELDRQGAGDQGMMFGYACDETDELMPLPIMLAHAICRRLADVRRQGIVDYLLPDGKAQVTIRYARGADGVPEPVRLDRVVVSTQHAAEADLDRQIRPDVIEHVLRATVPEHLLDGRRLDATDFVLVNPTGRFVTGGPVGDTGPDRTQDHRRHLRGHGPAWRRRVLGEGSEQGRPLRVVRGPLGRQERGRCGSCAALRAAGRLRDRGRGARERRDRDLRNPSHRALDDRDAGARALRPPARSDRARPESSEPDLSRDRRLRALRPARAGLHVGAHRPRGCPGARGGTRRRDNRELRAGFEMPAVSGAPGSSSIGCSCALGLAVSLACVSVAHYHPTSGDPEPARGDAQSSGTRARAGSGASQGSRPALNRPPACPASQPAPPLAPDTPATTRSFRNQL